MNPARSGAARDDQPAAVFIALGTAGGPVLNQTRSQPANAVVAGADIILLDAGDGAAGRLAAAGLRLDQVRAVFLSHLHLDHTAGLQGIIGLHWMNNIQRPLRVFGPRGTRVLVDRLIASMQPAREAGFGFDDGFGNYPLRIEVSEIVDENPIQAAPDIRVRAAENSHYSFTPGSAQAARSKALSYRIEAAGRTIVYTGDTGPSDAVTRLAKGADLLVSEVQDLPAIEEAIRRAAPDMPAPVRSGILRHLRLHHVSGEEVGRMAAAAGVAKLVLTHLGPAPPPAEADALYLPAVRKSYRGPAVVAVDLGRY